MTDESVLKCNVVCDAPPSTNLVIDFWSDVICQWCWIGFTRLKKALEAIDQSQDVTVIHHAYRLMPGSSPQPIEDIIDKRMGAASQDPLSAYNRVVHIGASEGLYFQIAGTFAGDTLEAHRLIKLSETEGKGMQMLERLFRAYHSERTSIFQRHNLLMLASSIGMDKDRTAYAIDSKQFDSVINADQRKRQQHGGNGVPLLLVGGKYEISGAQPYEQVLAVLENACRELKPDSVKGR